MQQNEAPRSEKGARRVNRLGRLEKLRRAVAQNVAQNAAEGRRNDADQRGWQNRSSDTERDSDAGRREQTQAERVNHHQSLAARKVLVKAQQKQRDRRQRENVDEEFPMLNPVERMTIEQHVAQSAAAERRNESDSQNADEIESAAARFNDAFISER